MRAIANLAVSADYRPNILQAKALPLAVSMLRNAQLQGSGSHTFAVLCHAARAIGNLCAGGEIAAAMQQKAAAEGSIAVLLPLLSREREHHEDMQRAGVRRAIMAQLWRNSAQFGAIILTPLHHRWPTGCRSRWTSCYARRCARWRSCRRCGRTSGR